MKIYVIFTGGTIGSRVKEDGTIGNDSRNYYLLEKYREEQPAKFPNTSVQEETIEYICSQPYRILSENLDFEHEKLLIQEVRTIIGQMDPEEKNGIIITHGTDTLQYSSSLIARLFSGINVPIVFVSAAYVLDDPRSNGLQNFHGAVEFIRYWNSKNGKLAAEIRNVVVSYTNGADGITRFYYPETLLAHSTYESDCHGVTKDGKEMIWGCMKENKVIPDERQKVYEEHLIRAEKYLEEIIDDVARVDTALSGEKSFSNVLWLHSCVGLKYPELTDELDSVMLESYHSGTLCICDELKQFAESARQKGIRIYVAGLDPEGSEYETVQEYRNLGIIPLPKLSPIYLYLALSCNETGSEINSDINYSKLNFSYN